MTILYVVGHAGGVGVFTHLDKAEAHIVGDVHLMVYPGEKFGGMTFDQLMDIAKSAGRFDSDNLTC